MTENELMVKPDPLAPELRANMLAGETSMFLNVARFEQGLRIATMISKTDFIPANFKGNVGNCMIALDLAERMHMHPIMLMQSMYIVHNRPGFEGKFVAALINNSGRYEGPLRYEWKGAKGQKEWGCRAYGFLKGKDERIDGPWVDWEMVTKEGWNKPSKNKATGATIPSKWETMPELMFKYRAVSFFGKTNDADLLMGMSTLEELEDTEITMLQKPSGEFTMGDEPKSAGLYEPTKQPPKFEQEEPEPDAPKEPEPEPQEATPSAWDIDNWWKLKEPGMIDFVKKHSFTFFNQPGDIQRGFRAKWNRVCGDKPFPLDKVEAPEGEEPPEATEPLPEKESPPDSVLVDHGHGIPMTKKEYLIGNVNSLFLTKLKTADEMEICEWITDELNKKTTITSVGVLDEAELGYVVERLERI